MEILILLLMFFGFACGLLTFAFWVWMLVDAIQNEPDYGNDKAVWILIIVVAQFVGALIYYFVRRPQRDRLQRQTSYQKPKAT